MECGRMKILRLLFLAAAASVLASCSSYMTPGRPADLSTFTDPQVKKAFSARPAIRFPANIAVVRVQEGGYRNDSSTAHGQGAYSVMTTREIEKETDMDALRRLPGVEDVVTLNRLLLPKNLSSDLDLREAAAKLQADVILLYTLQTEFRSKDVLPPALRALPFHPEHEPIQNQLHGLSHPHGHEDRLHLRRARGSE